MSPSQPSADKVKEVTAFSKECLEKIETSRIERDYPEVHNTAFCFFFFFLFFSSFSLIVFCCLCFTILCPLSLSSTFYFSYHRWWSYAVSVWRSRRTSWLTLTCISSVCSALPVRCFRTCITSLRRQTTLAGWWRGTCECWQRERCESGPTIQDPDQKSPRAFMLTDFSKMPCAMSLVEISLTLMWRLLYYHNTIYLSSLSCSIPPRPPQKMDAMDAHSSFTKPTINNTIKLKPGC